MQNAVNIFDLHGEAEMTPLVGMLYSAVKENNERLQTITNGMLQEEVDYKGPDDGYNSTAQLIKHLTYVDLNWVYRIKEQALPSVMQDEYGPMIGEDNKLPMVKGKSLTVLMSGYEHVLSLLKEACMQLTDADLDKVVAFGHHNEKRATVRWGLWHMADHSRYHQAHIHLLRRWYQERS